jgi:hypothetical protein
MAIVELERPRLRAVVTSEAADSMQLAPSVSVVAILKATAITYLGAGRMTGAVRLPNRSPSENQ